ncbi:hypothetical protein RHMOL_Rhmol01G0076000 [Rhododendron molle]|uniref:Uncharacterized protein n=1 Tax=Rhododendron molle TaxID=49168 RepID=A0ACC0Q0H0_RHOML|nr:hypothetical protein RHMOL_Rhmol01G0076000 [Rhododendron molle]
MPSSLSLYLRQNQRLSFFPFDETRPISPSVALSHPSSSVAVAPPCTPLVASLSGLGRMRRGRKTWWLHIKEGFYSVFRINSQITSVLDCQNRKGEEKVSEVADTILSKGACSELRMACERYWWHTEEGLFVR